MDIAAGYASLTAAFHLAKGLKDVHDQVKINEIVIQLQGRIMEAQEAVRDGRDKLNELQNELSKYKSWENTSINYKLKDFGGQTFAYEYVYNSADRQPDHIACPNCYSNQKISILQFAYNSSGRMKFNCHSCDKEFLLGSRDEPAANTYHSVATRRDYGGF